MAETLKFTFDTAFGTRSEHEPVQEALPVITQADVDAARTQGFIQGREDGLSEATAQFSAETRATFDKITNGLTQILSAQAAAATAAITQAENYALLIAQKIAKAALVQHPTLQVKALVDDCLSHINLMPHLVIRVNESMSQQVQTELQPIIAEKGFEGKLIILGEENIPLGDCAIEWADGGVAHNTQEIVKTISNKLADYFGFDAEAVQADVEPEPNTDGLELIDETADEDDDGDIFAADEFEDDNFEQGDEPDQTDEQVQETIETIEASDVETDSHEASTEIDQDLDTDDFDDLIDPDEMDAAASDAGDFIEVVQKEQAEQMDETMSASSDLEGQIDE
ncbi:MAG: FliH/SctL family protein [Hyphomicrobiales bacterium]